MARDKPVILAIRRFTNQLNATAFFKTILNRYKLGDRVAEVNALDLAALLVAITSMNKRPEAE